MGVRFLTEIFLRNSWPPELAIAADDIGREYNVYFFDTTRPDDYETTYWADWGGTYDDLPNVASVQVIMGQTLQQVESQVDMQNTENSFWISGTLVYMNLTYKPWQYEPTATELQTALGFANAAKDPNNPSNILYGEMKYPTRLSTPSVNTKLSDAVSGVTLLQEWSISLANEDGRFDDVIENNFLNTPIRILKYYGDTLAVPTVDDFKVIRYGLVNNQKTTFTNFNITASDIWRSLDQDMLRKYSLDDFPDADDNIIDKNIPQLWGDLVDVPLTEVGTNEYYAGDYITAVSAVYDSDGTSLSFTFSSSTGIITEATGEASTADVTGSTTNMIGQMIVDAMETHSNIYYNDSSWDTAEADAYRTSSPEVNFYFSTGTVQAFISALLANDDAHLIQKNNGQLTLRKYGTTYNTHSIDSWRITSTSLPQRNYTDAKTNFLSSIQINYGENISSGTFNNTYFDDSQEDAIFEEWRATSLTELDSDLANLTDVEALGDSRLSRFGGYKETVKISLGYDTSEVELLDTVEISILVNDRQFSDVTTWIVKEVDPAQDTLVLEEA